MGLIVPILFACIWSVMGVSALPIALHMPGIAGSLAVSAILTIAVLQAPLRAAGRFDSAIFGMAVMFEAAAIVAAVILLNRTHEESFIPPAIAAIVGLHFIGLWRATGDFIFVWVATAMCAVGLAAALSPLPARAPVAGLGSAVALWGAAVVTLVRLRAATRSQADCS
jgi:hypothetical protein